MRLSENSASQCITYQDLPSEILRIIVSFNNLSDKIVLAKVCDTWRTVIQNESEYKQGVLQISLLFNARNHELRKIITSESRVIPQEIAIPRWGNLLSSEIKYERFEVSVYENRYQRAKRLQPDIDTLKNQLSIDVQRYIPTKFKIECKKDRFVLNLGLDKPRNWYIESADLDCLGGLFQMVLRFLG